MDLPLEAFVGYTAQDDKGRGRCSHTHGRRHASQLEGQQPGLCQYLTEKDGEQGQRAKPQGYLLSSLLPLDHTNLFGPFVPGLFMPADIAASSEVTQLGRWTGPNKL